MAQLPVDIEDDEKKTGRFMLSMRWKVSLVGLCFLLILGSIAWSGVPRFVQAINSIATSVSEDTLNDDSQGGGTETPLEESVPSLQRQYPGYQGLLFNDMDLPGLMDWQGGEIRVCWDRSMDRSQGPGSWSSQPLNETTEHWHSMQEGCLALRLSACPPEGSGVADCADADSPVKVSYRWNGLGEGIREAPQKVMEVRLRCSDSNEFGGSMGWGFSAMSEPNNLDEGLIVVDDLSFFSPLTMGPRFETYSSESDSSLEGFWVTCGGSSGNAVRKRVAGIDLTGWHTYTIFWEEGNATFLVDGARLAELLSPPGDASSQQVASRGMGVSVYLENTIYSPENDDQANFESLDTLLRDFLDGASRLGSRIPSFRYGASDLEDDKWIEIDYISFNAKPEQSALSGGFIPDRNLESIITETLEISAGLTKEDMLGLVSLSARSQGITDLGGLEYASNLEELSLPNNTITDISPLSGLTKLRSLRLDGNEMRDISPLADLENLETLHIDTDSVDDPSPISRLVGLEELTIRWSEDLSLLTSLASLRVLKLFHDDIVDISPLSSLVNLQEVWILGNQIVDLSPLTHLEKLEDLVLSENYRALPETSPILDHIKMLVERGIAVQYIGCE